MGDVRALRVTAQWALLPPCRRALGGLGEQLLQQALALVAAGLVIDPGRGLLRRWGVRGRQQREEGRRRLRGPAPQLQLEAQGLQVRVGQGAPPHSPGIAPHRLLLLLGPALLLLSLRSCSDYGPEFLADVLRGHAASNSTPVRGEAMQGVLLKAELGGRVEAKDGRRGGRSGSVGAPGGHLGPRGGEQGVAPKPRLGLRLLLGGPRGVDPGRRHGHGPLEPGVGRGSGGGAPPGGEGELLPKGGRVAGQARAGGWPQESARLHGLLLLLLLGLLLLLLPHLNLAPDKAHLLRLLLLLLLLRAEGTL